MSDEPLDLSMKSSRCTPDTQSGLQSSATNEPMQHDGENGVNGSFDGVRHTIASRSSSTETISSNGHTPSCPPGPTNSPQEPPHSFLRPDLPPHLPSFSKMLYEPSPLDSIKAFKATAAKTAASRAAARTAKAKAVAKAAAAAAAVPRDDAKPLSSNGQSPSGPPIPTNSPQEPPHSFLLPDLPLRLPSFSKILCEPSPLDSIKTSKATARAAARAAKAKAAETAVPRDDTKPVSGNGQSPSGPPVPNNSPQEPPHTFLRPKDLPPKPPSSNILVGLVPLATIQAANAAAAKAVAAAAVPQDDKPVSSNGQSPSCPPVPAKSLQEPPHTFLRPKDLPPHPPSSNMLVELPPIQTSIQTAGAAATAEVAAARAAIAAAARAAIAAVARAAPDIHSGLQNSVTNEPTKRDGENGVNDSFDGVRQTIASRSSSTETISSNGRAPFCPPGPTDSQEPPHTFLRPDLFQLPPSSSNMLVRMALADSILRAAAAKAAEAAAARAAAAEAAVTESAAAAVPRDYTKPVSEERLLNSHLVPIRPSLMPHVHPFRSFRNSIIGTGYPLTAASANLQHLYPNAAAASLHYSNLTIASQTPHIVAVPRKRRAETTNGSSNGTSCASNSKIRHRSDDQSASSDGNNSESCAGKSSESCAGKSSDSCAGNSSESCAGNSSESCAGNSSESCAGNNSESCAGDNSASTAPNPASKEDSAEGHDEKRNPSTSEVKKDEAYLARRKRNNEAAKRSRDSRRERVDEVSGRLVRLELEHTTLLAQVDVMTRNIIVMRHELRVRELAGQ